MPKWKRRQLKRNPRPQHSKHSLTSAIAGGVEIDREAGTIRNVPVITAGPAIGHGFSVDATTLKQVASLIGSGVPINLTHEYADSLPARLGMLVNVRIEGDAVRGDIQLSEAAKHSPHGDMWNFILALAADQPDQFGLSITFDDAGYEEIEREKYIRVSKVYSADFVGTPAANPTGILKTKGSNMDALLEVLRGMGLPEEITDPDQVAAWMKGRESAMTPDEPEPTEETPTEEPEEGASTPEPEAVAASAVADPVKLTAQVTQGERQRIAGLRKLAATHKLTSDWVVRHAENGTALDVATKMAAELIATRQEGLNMNVSVGNDNKLGTLAGRISGAIRLRAGTMRDPSKAPEGSEQFRGLQVLDMFRHYLAERGAADAFRLSRTQLASMAINPKAMYAHYGAHGLAQSSSDFDYILADTVNKTLAQVYADAPRNWNLWCRRATAPDFKTITRTKLTESPTPTSRNEGGPISYVTLSDSRETYALTEYVSGIKLTRKALINDDMDAFGRIPTMQGLACGRLEDDVAYAILTANAVLSDGVALFEASTHKNLVSSGNAVISVTSLAKTAGLMRVQKGTGGAAFLNIEPAFLIVPVALEVVAMQTIGSIVDPAKNNATPNPYSNRLQVVANPRLDATSVAYWYLAANPATGVDTVEVCFLEDEPAPTLKQEVEFDTEDMKFAVRHTVAAKAIDYRGLARNNGA